MCHVVGKSKTYHTTFVYLEEHPGDLHLLQNAVIRSGGIDDHISFFLYATCMIVSRCGMDWERFVRIEIYLAG